MWWRSVLIVSLALLASTLLYRYWEARESRPDPVISAMRTDLITLSNLHAGGGPAPTFTGLEIPEERNAFDVAEGKRLYHWFNCVGCHANGGGDIGPALMDAKWIYGSEPANIFSTIVEGRPNGMPSFRGKIPDKQVWQLVAYVRSMAAQVPIYALPGRNDDLSAKEPETMAPVVDPVDGGLPPVDSKTTIK
jgi:cytochrome c oxidase cbb3-type subunit 3